LLQGMGLGARHYASQGGPHNDYREYRDNLIILSFRCTTLKVVHLKLKIIIHINGFYLPCPTLYQMTLTKDLIDHVGKKSASGFSVNIISPGTSVNQHCGFASQIEREGSPRLSIVLYVKLDNGVAPNYEEIQSLYEKIVELSTDSS